MPPPGVPRATYRLQFHKDFGFDDARRIVPYLAALGISHVYASPLTMARPGSTHGYDVIDFNRLNPELGDDAAFEALIAELRAHDMGLLLDFVPNHMGVGSDNPWWLDVLEWGPLSPYATFFDIDWEASARGTRGKLTLPVLGDQYGKVLETGDLKLQFDAAAGTFHVAYYDQRFPVGVRRYPQLLRSTANLLARDGIPLFELADKFASLYAEDAGLEQEAVRRQEAFALKEALAEAASDTSVREALDATVAAQNGTPGLPETFEPLHALLEDQAYRLAYWRVASSEINYRRFFDINQLAGLRMERGEVFEATHRLLLRLIAEGKVHGVRLDHIDGMYDPRGYCQRLLSRVADVLAESRDGERPEIDARSGRPIYLLVEKILARHENLREDLPVAGTTGYEFISLVNGLFLDPAAERSLTTTYHRFVEREPEFDQVVLAAKQQILRYSLNSELHVLGSRVLSAGAAELADPGLHADRPARGARRHHHALSGLPDLHHRGRRQTGRPARSRLGGEPGAAGDRAGRPHGVRFPARRAVHGSGRHARLRARRRHRHRDALPAADRAGHGEVARGHRVLSLQSSGLAQRGGRRTEPFRGAARPPSITSCSNSSGGIRLRCSPPLPMTTSGGRTCARA